MHHADRQFPRVFVLAIGLLAGTGTSLAAAADASAKPPLTGEQVYRNVCSACHSPPGAGGAPALGNAEAWAPRIAQGMDTLIEHALKGFVGKAGVMPRKGERPDLSDDEVISAVQYMVEQSTPAEEG